MTGASRRPLSTASLHGMLAGMTNGHTASPDPAAGPLTCLVCGEHDWAPLHEILLKCGSCGFITARLDRPIQARALYEGDYFTGEEYLDYLADEPFFRRNFRQRLDLLRTECSGGRLLEIGAAYGFFLDLARAYFDVVGFEVNPAAVRHARERLGLDVRSDDFCALAADNLGGRFDVTVMWDVIEHLDRPDLFIHRIAELSGPAAWLHITTGDIGSRVARWRGRRWRMIHPPSHLHYFSRETITRLLDNHGFHVLDIRSEGVARSWRQVLYSILVLRMGARGAYEWIKRAVPARAGFTLNLGDIMHVVARRKA